MAGEVDHAHYSLKLIHGNLEGTYHEDGEFGPTNEMKVRILFDDATGRTGQFQLARLTVPAQPNYEADESEPPQPQPVPEPKTAFDFDFRAQSDGRFHVSETRWLGRDGGTAQFLATDDAFVFSKYVCKEPSAAKEPNAAAALTAWTASRRGAPRFRAAAAEGKQSLYQKYRWYLFVAIVYTAWKALQSKAAEMAAMAGGAKKKK